MYNNGNYFRFGNMIVAAPVHVQRLISLLISSQMPFNSSAEWFHEWFPICFPFRILYSLVSGSYLSCQARNILCIYTVADNWISQFNVISNGLLKDIASIKWMIDHLNAFKKIISEYIRFFYVRSVRSYRTFSSKMKTLAG